MTPLEIEALVSLGTKVVGLMLSAKNTLEQIKADHPEVYQEISRRFVETDAHLAKAAGL